MAVVVQVLLVGAMFYALGTGQYLMAALAVTSAALMWGDGK